MKVDKYYMDKKTGIKYKIAYALNTGYECIRFFDGKEILLPVSYVENNFYPIDIDNHLWWW